MRSISRWPTCAGCARSLPERVSHHAAALESVERRSGDDRQRPAWACRADADRRRDRRDPLEARHHRGGSRHARYERCRHLRGPAFLAGDDCEHADLRGRRRVRPGDFGPHARPLRAHGAGTSHGPQRGLRSRRQCRDCRRGRRCRMGILTAFGLPARTDLRGVIVGRRIVHPECRHRPRARTRRGCRDTDRAAFALARAERLPALAHFRLLRAAVSSFQRAFAAAGRPEACRGVQGCSDRHDVGVHYRRATHHAADRDRGWPERRPCRAQADPAHWVRRVAATRGALHVLRSDLVADRRPVARRSGRGHFSARSRRW